MKRVERLELENKVLRNVIDCALERIEIGNRLNQEKETTLCIAEAVLDYQRKMNYALAKGYTLDYRRNAVTIGDCMEDFQKFGTRVVLNDGMIVDFQC